MEETVKKRKKDSRLILLAYIKSKDKANTPTDDLIHKTVTTAPICIE